ncbi:hypothetical protein ACGFRG_05380 [Streptomyces sp. NPDC048696]|uniref:hypothetical protein n=1 Tax=Streptomyces sp. NPDC048696 TaxID=3365585 RepID=UPI003717F66E
MPATTTPFDELAYEQYGHPLSELLGERYSVQQVLQDRHRRLNKPQTSPRSEPRPDPNAAQHRATLEAAIATWTYRPTST